MDLNIAQIIVQIVGVVGKIVVELIKKKKETKTKITRKRNTKPLK